MTHLSLFSGIGGLDLAAEMAGFTTVGQCEWADYPTKVLEKHWPDVPRWRDIRTLTGESFFEKTGLRTVDILSGGFPCQPFSVAGKQKGKGDERYLWPEMLRIIRELTPRWIIGENVPGILRIAARDVVQDLEREGYNVAVFDFEAAAVGAPHRRERVAFVANREKSGERRLPICAWGSQQENADAYGLCAVMENANRPERRTGQPGEHVPYGQNAGWEEKTGWFRTSSSDGGEKNVADADRIGSEPYRAELLLQKWKSAFDDGCIKRRTQWAVEPGVGRVVNGLPHRVDRIKCLGNAVVPQQFYPFFKAIYDVEAIKKNVSQRRAGREL